MTKERTQEEIDEQIKWLTDNKCNLPQNTAFGDNNWAKIDAQISVLKEVMDEEEIRDKEENGEWSENEVEGATEVLNWRDDGDDEAKPSESWMGLLGRGKVDVLTPPYTSCALPASSLIVLGGKPGGRVSVAKPNLSSKPKPGVKPQPKRKVKK